LIEVDESGVVQIGAQAQATVDIGAMKSVMLGGHAAANATGSITLSGVEQVKDIPGQRYCFDLGARGCRAGDCSGRLRIYGYSDAGKLLKEWVSPGGTGSGPYGIAVTKGGEVWYSESGVKPNTLVKFDPKSESFNTEPIPSGGGVVRNMVATPDRRLYLACSGVNKVAVVDLNR
jgi:hypothetical protein